MRNRIHIIVKIVFSLIIMLLIPGILTAQEDLSKKSPPTEKSSAVQSEVRQEGVRENEMKTVQDQKQIQDKDNKKQKVPDQKDVKEVKSSNPDLKKSKGARPPYISRPSGSARPKGAGNPAGAGRPGRK
jgi:hypothetical protein